MPATFDTVLGRTSVMGWNSLAICTHNSFDGVNPWGISSPRARNWYAVPDAIERRSTPATEPSLSVMPALLKSSATSRYQPSVSWPDFSVDDQTSITSSALAGAAAVIGNSSSGGNVSARLAPVGGGIDALRVTGVSTQSMSSASSSSCLDACAASSGSPLSLEPHAAATIANVTT